MTLAGKQIVMTGGAGYIGSAVAARLAGVARRIVRIRRQVSESASDNPVVEVAGDIADLAVWMRELAEADVVFHLAGQTSAAAANADPLADWRANVLPMIQLLDACRRLGRTPTIVFAGSATQVGMTTTWPVNEGLADRPVTVYDVHKLAAEQCLETAVRMGVARGTTLRLANVYGPGPRSSSADRGILNRMICRAIRGEALTVFGAGDPVRDYTYIDDVANAFVAAAEHAELVNGRHFVIGSGRGITIREAMDLVSRQVAAKTGVVAPVVEVEPPAGMLAIEQRSFAADTSAFERATSWRAAVTLEAGIDAMIDFVRHSQEGPV